MMRIATGWRGVSHSMSDERERTFLSRAERRRAEWLRAVRERTDKRTDEETQQHLANPQGDEVLPTDADNPHEFGAD